ncbi:MAG: hypothetical protein JXR83_09320 [Deltaproteobacteria bacterium]|nr:hypothetical protein [Deltaproteobacteria bacterium]
MLTGRCAVALVTAATLLFEVTLTRVLSFTLWYHFAFLVVGVALLGTAAAGSWLSVRAGGAAGLRPARWALTLALALPLAHALFQLLPFEPFRLATQPAQWAIGALGIALLAAPFFATGVVIASLLSEAGPRAHTVYAADLIGAGAGAALAPLAIRWLGAPGAVIAAGVAAALAAVLFALASERRSWLVAGASCALALAVLVPLAQRVLPWRVTDEKKIGKLPAEQVLRDPGLTLYTGWDIASRVDVVESERGARILVDGGTSVTRVPEIPADLSALAPFADVNTIALQSARGGDVLVVGSGGGWEVLRALAAGAGHVDAVEVNPLVVGWVRADQRFATARLHRDPRVSLIQDEARAFLAASDRRYAAILMVHTISNAAYGAGAMSLAEDYVLTVEAMRLLFDRLHDGGLLLITRPTAQLKRVVETIAAAAPACRQQIDACAMAFIDPGSNHFFSGVIAARRPMAAAQRVAITEALILAKLSPLKPSLVKPPQQRALTRPATDDRPYFAQRVAFSDLTLVDFRGVLGDTRRHEFVTSTDGRMALEDRPVAEVAAVGTGLIAAGVGLVGVLLPLLLARRTRRQLARQPLSTSVRFVAIGLAFMFVEIALMQKLTRVVGHPSLAFAVTLGSLLVGSGAASQWLAPWFARRLRPMRDAMLFAAAGVGLVAVGSSTLLYAVDALPLGPRIGVAIALGTGIGLVLGSPFAVALTRVSARGESVPWAYGVNGFASVVAPALAVMLGAEIGLTSTLLIGAALYAVAGLLPEQARPDTPLPGPRPDQPPG